MDPAETKVFRQRQGAVDISDFDEELRPRRPKRKAKKRRPKSYQAAKGCSENDHGPHVYVWTSEFMYEDLFYRFYGYHKYTREVCVGCRKTRKKALTERYEKIRDRRYRNLYGSEFSVVRGQGPVSRPRWGYHRRPSMAYFSWEDQDPDYQAYRRDYIKMYGYTKAVKGNLYDWW